ncbi:hypothetical protein Rhe02_15740 [Rhizocola hellebori]|uniref:Uncharacterized protein n=1 Tax=Rhizocola hellebori TaxID=1392758 RepID=A0A8J3VEP1_9ACTN|nr:hypothetical protein [Rhizocola hellebori]GIH03507.1 hypothetical protein Rhe02_15740 [Rhizocola hellebori]
MKGILRRGIIGMTGVGLACASMMAIASPAHASYDELYVKSGSTILGKCILYGDYDVAKVADWRQDGIGVYGRYKLRSGTIVDVNDPDGAGGNDGYKNWQGTGNHVVAFECVARDGHSSGWLYIT